MIAYGNLLGGPYFASKGAHLPTCPSYLPPALLPATAGPRAYPRREIVTRVNGLWVPGGHINLPALVNYVISLQ